MKKTNKEFVPKDAKNSTARLDLRKMEPAVFPILKPSSTTISLRLSNSMLHKLKVMANRRHVPYQSLIKILLAEKLEP